MKISLYHQGQTTAFQDGEQVPFLQKSWIKLYIEFLVQHGVDPTAVDIEIVGTGRVKVFKTEEGYNWNIE